jgi:uncharacterized protein
MNNAQENKRLIQAAFEDLSKGDGSRFIDMMAEDIKWNVTGSTKWSKTYESKHAVLSELLMPLFEQFSGAYRNTADRIIAEDEIVVIECHGEATTKSGKQYNNRYCFICRLDDGRIVEVTEYFDTELATAVLTG